MTNHEIVERITPAHDTRGTRGKLVFVKLTFDRLDKAKPKSKKQSHQQQHEH